MVTDDKARKAVETLKQYCIEHTTCVGCIFAQEENFKCLLCDKDIFDWKLDDED